MTDSGQSPRLLHFGTFELDLSSNKLRKAGVLIKLQSQHFQLLVLLAERAGQVVTREEIRRTLWNNGTFVDFDRRINFCVNQIRGALGDDPQSPRYIETLPRQGYRFVAPVTEAGGEPAKVQSAPEPWPSISCPGTAVVAAERRRRDVPGSDCAGGEDGRFAAPRDETDRVAGRVAAGEPLARSGTAVFRRRNDRRIDHRAGEDQRATGSFTNVCHAI